MKKKVKKNQIYLTLDDLNKLYGLDGKLLKKLKKKRKKRKKTQKGIKFEKIKDSSQMPGVQYFTNNASNSDTQYLKDQIKSLQDKQEKQNKLLITDVQPNLVNNRLLTDLKQDNENIKNAMNIMYKQAGETFNYLYDSIEDFSNNKGGFTVNYNDNIGDFSNLPNWTDPKETDEKKQTNNTLSNKSESYETPYYIPRVDINSYFYDDNTSGVMEPNTEEKQVNDDQQPDDIIEETKEDIIEDTKEETPFIEPQKEIISDPFTDKPPFVPPAREKDEHPATYKARVEFLRKLYYGLPITDYSYTRWRKKLGNIV